MAQKNECGCRHAIQRLRDAGLCVSPEKNSSLGYSIGRNNHDQDWSGIKLFSKSLQSRVAVDYWSDEWPWSIRHWDLMPGPGMDEFECEFPTQEEAVEAVLAFYFGRPSTIDDWVVPLHVHPELSEKQIRTVLGQARIITETQFEAVQTERVDTLEREVEKRERPMKEWLKEIRILLADELAGKDVLAELEIICKMERAGTIPPRPELAPYSAYTSALGVQFLRISHMRDTSKTLRLRRDLQESYIVLAG
ncbi:MAG: hypothetical protein WAU05_03590 [Nitrospira sp.]